MSMWKDVRETEREALRACKTRLDNAERQLAVAERASAIKGAPGFDAFVEKLTELRDAVTRELVGTHATDAYLRVLQGKAQALGDILSIMKRGDSRLSQLAERVKEAQNALDDVQRRIPKQTLAETKP